MAGGGGKVATWTTSSGSGTSSSSIWFDIEAEPTEWLLICVGTSSSSVSVPLGYIIINALKQSSSYVEGTYMRSNGRIYSGQNIISTSYSNNTFTLTAATNYAFMRYGGSSAGYATYYLLYNTN